VARLKSLFNGDRQSVSSVARRRWPSRLLLIQKRAVGAKPRVWTVGPKPSRARILGMANVLLLLAAALVFSSGEAIAATTSSHPTTTARHGTSTPGTSRPGTSRLSTSTTHAPKATTTTTHPAGTTRGPQTILSPIGVNVRSGPSTSDKVIGSAAQGVALLRLGHTDKNGGWYEVSGATVIGWISANPELSAPGRFGYYSSGAFNVLFPAGWTTSGKPNIGVVFKSHSAGEEVVVTASTSVAKLPTVAHAAGVSEDGLQQVVACGVSGYLYSYRTGTPGRFFADAAFPLAAGHALGLKATLTSMSEIKTVLDFINSISFPLPICVGHPATSH
jgi:hypothetical protein